MKIGYHQEDRAVKLRPAKTLGDLTKEELLHWIDRRYMLRDASPRELNGIRWQLAARRLRQESEVVERAQRAATDALEQDPGESALRDYLAACDRQTRIFDDDDRLSDFFRRHVCPR